jgi:hypothetical protein
MIIIIFVIFIQKKNGNIYKQVFLNFFFMFFLVNNFFVLLSYFVHQASPPETFEDLFNNIFDYVDNLFSIVRPRKLLYMAIGETVLQLDRHVPYI